MKVEIQHVVMLFARMRHLYGHKWHSLYGQAMENNAPTSAAKQWLMDLQDFTEDQVRIGMIEVEKRSEEWPPGVLEFKAMCQGVPSVEQVLDVKNDYGPICAQLRGNLDWYNLEGMSSKDKYAAAARAINLGLTNLRGSGDIKRLSLAHLERLALTRQVA